MRFRRATAVAAVFALAAAFAAAPDRAAYAKNEKAGGPQDQIPLKGKGKPDHAGGQGKGGKPDKADKREGDDRDYGDRDRDRERYRDRDYRDYRDEDVVEQFRRYRDDRGDRTPDYLRNPKALPPGIAMNLQRGKPLPPGIAKKVDDDDLLRRLPRTYSGSEWYAAGDRLVEYDPVNEAIIHVIDQALYGGRR